MDNRMIPPASHSNPTPPVKILVVDDHPMIRRGIASLIRASEGLECVAEASDGQEALEICGQMSVDIVLMDMIMPRMDGASATLAIRAKHPNVRVLILSSFYEQDQVQNAMRAGAMGYLLKTASADELVAAIRAAHAGQRTLAPEATEALVQATSPVGTNLTERERRILELLSEGLSNQDIADRLSITLATVKFHVTNVLSKLNVNSRTEAVLLALKHRLVPSPSFR
jgi:two-component system, NarL family, response regulator LiaR